MKRKSLISTFLVTLLATFALLSACQSTPEVEEANTETETEVEVTETTEETEEVMEEEEMEETEETGVMSGAPAATFLVDSFSFGYSTTEIRVKEGQTVTINLTNSDGFHDWVVDEFGAATEQIKEGETSTVTFVADKKGTFEFYCSVGNHRAQGMVGTLIVE